MKTTTKNWVWFVLIMALILGAGIYLGQSRRTELGKSFDYSLAEYRRVDPSLIHYKETQPLEAGLGVQKLGALAVDEGGKVYVTGYNSISVFSTRLAKPEIYAVSGRPTCVTVDDQGLIYLGFQTRVDVLKPTGALKTSWAIQSEKAHFTSIAVEGEYVYVADAGNRRIWRYDKAGGEPLEMGKKDSANGVRGFNIPSPYFDIDIGTDGSLWAVNSGYHALENYRSDGTPISSWKRSGFTIEGFSGCCNPSHFALMPDGSFVTAEKGLPRVKIHNKDGSLRCVVAAPDQFDEGVVGLDVAVDDEGRIYVLDPRRNQVRIFEEKE